MKEDFVAYTVGDLFGMALKTDRPNTTDLSGRTMFGWTGVPVVIAGPNGSIEYVAEYMRSTDTHQDFIMLVPKEGYLDEY